MMEEYGISDVSCDNLPRGVIVGTVELYDCDDDEWYLRNPERATNSASRRTNHSRSGSTHSDESNRSNENATTIESNRDHCRHPWQGDSGWEGQ